MPPKTQHLQIRVTTAQKALLKRRAAACRMDVSSYVLRKVLPPVEVRWEELLEALAGDEDHRPALAALNVFLSGLDSATFREVTGQADLRRLSPFLQNYVAAMVEELARRLGVPAPAWAADVEPLDDPHFGASLPEVRPMLLRNSPVAFKRRNLFVDAGVGEHL